MKPTDVARLQRKSRREALEDRLARDLVALGVGPPMRQFRFCSRRWRFDFAWPDAKLAVEVDGGTWSGGRHTRGSGYEKDTQKLNAANLLGWTLLRYTGGMVRSGEAAREIAAALGGAAA